MKPNVRTVVQHLEITGQLIYEELIQRVTTKVAFSTEVRKCISYYELDFLYNILKTFLYIRTHISPLFYCHQ